MRVEVSVPRADSPLIRRVAAALGDPSRGELTRMALYTHLRQQPARGFKALLLSAPLEGIDLRRARDKGRKVKL